MEFVFVVNFCKFHVKQKFDIRIFCYVDLVTIQMLHLFYIIVSIRNLTDFKQIIFLSGRALDLMNASKDRKYQENEDRHLALRGRSGFLEIVFVGECEVLVCL